MKWPDPLRRRDPGDRRVTTPTLFQMEAVECGAASLGIVLGHFKRFVSLEVLRVDCGVSRDGSNANNVLKAARKHGMVARGCRKEVGQLKSLTLPLIVFWNFNHFVVLEGWRKGKYYLNDPATGPRVVTEAEFDASFTGVVLVLSPGEDFEPGGERHRLWKGLRSRLAGSEHALSYVVLAGLALVVPGLVIPTFARVFVDNILVQGLSDWTRPLLLAIAITALLRAALTHLQQRFLLRLETKIALTTASRFFWHVLRLPAEFFSQRFAGDIATRIALNDRIAQLLSERLATTALSVVMVVFFAALMLQYDVALTMIAVAIALANVLALRLVARRRVDENQRLQQEHAKLHATSVQGLQIVETLKAAGGEMDFFARWSGYQAKVMNVQQRLDLSTRLLGEVPPLLGSMNAMLILGIGGMRVIDGHLSMGMLVAFQSLAASFIGPIAEFVQLGSLLQNVEADMSRLDDVLAHRPDPLLETGRRVTDGRTDVRLEGYLELRGLTFGYSRLDKPLLQSFDLRLEPGSRVALVGSSGSGKSTVARLVAGLYEPWEGEILFDGRPRAEWPRELITNSLAMVDQDIFMMAGTIRDNLTLWDTTVDEAILVRAAKDARIHDDITARPGGYDNLVSEAGRNFSGGQRQRLEIARALVTKPTLLVLDEATSALDPRTEAEVDDNLRRRGCTCLIVAHRLSTIRDCDEIVVLERGRVVQRGSHDQLIAADGAYRRLIEEG